MAMMKGALRQAIEDFLNRFEFEKVLHKWYKFVLEGFERETANRYRQSLDEIAAVEGLPDNLKALLNDPDLYEAQGGIATMLGFGAQMGMSAASSFMAPAMRLLNYKMDRGVHSARFDPSLALAVAFRFPNQLGFIMDNLKDLGYSDEQISQMYEVYKQRVGVGDIITLWMRKEITEEEVTHELLARGWDVEEVNKIKALRKIIPSPQDLITLAVREAWDDAAISRFQYDAELPTEAQGWAEKQGLDAEWFRKYWVAHWQLPGLREGFEMLHRLRPGKSDTPFTMDDMRLLIKTHDFPPFWRDKLIKIAYAPYTRVDIRRMYGLGVLSKGEVKEAYLDLGYNDEHAENLTRFTVLSASEKERNLSQAAIINGFKRGVVSEDEARGALVDLGYSTENATYLIALAKYDLAKKETDAEIALVRADFIDGKIDEAEASGRLAQLGLPSQQANTLMKTFIIAKRRKTKRPTLAMLKDYYRHDLITLDDFKQGLKRLHYEVQDVENITRVFTDEVARDAQEAQEKADLALLKAQRSSKLDTYRKRAAELNAQIAALRVLIANDKLALLDVTDASEKEGFAREITQYKALIAKLTYDKAVAKRESV